MAYDLLANKTTDIYQLYIRNYLLQQASGTGIACDTSNYTTWVDVNLCRFMQLATVNDLVMFNKNLSKENMTAEETAVLLTNPQVISNSSMLQEILHHLDKENISLYLEAFTAAAIKANLTDTQATTVKEAMFNAVFEAISSNFSSLTSDNCQSLFGKDLLPLLPYIQENHIQQLPTDISCSCYQGIVNTFCMAYDLLANKTTDIYQLYIRNYLLQQASGTGIACDTSNYTTWVDVNLCRFMQLATVNDLVMFNKNLSKENMTAEETAVLLTNPQVISNSSMLQEILHHLDKENISLYLEAFTAAAIKANLTDTQATTVKEAMFNAVFEAIISNFSSLTSDNCQSLFGKDLLPLLPYIQENHIQQLPTNISCSCYQGIVNTFCMAYDLLANKTTDIYQLYIRNYLLQQASGTGIACDTSNYTTWVDVNLCRFMQLATVNDLVMFNKNLSKENMTAEETAVLLTNPQVISNSSMLQEILHHLDKENISLYLEAFTAAAIKANLTDTQATTVKEAMFNAVFEAISSNFSSLTSDNCQSLFGKDLLPLLPYIQENHIQQLPTNISCSCYQGIVNTFCMAYDLLANKTTDIYQLYIRNYLLQQASGTGIACDTSNYTTWVDVNLCRFMQLATVNDLVMFNKNLSKENMTAEETAVLLTNPQVISNSSMLQEILHHLDKENISLYLEAFTAAAIKANLTDTQATTVKEAMFNAVFEAISSNFSSLTSDNCQSLFGKDLLPLLPYIQENHIQQLPTNISCSCYQGIVNTFCMAYDLLANKTTDIYQLYIRNYLLQQASGTGIACDTSNYTTWVDVNLCRFMQLATVNDLVMFNKNLSKENMTAEETAVLLTNPQVISNSSMLQEILHHLDKENISLYLEAFTAAAIKANLTDTQATTVKEAMFNAVFEAISSNFSSLTSDNCQSLFGKDLLPLLPYIQENHIQQLPTNISCSCYQGIVNTFCMAYDLLANKTTDIYQLYIRNYLLQQASGTGQSQRLLTNMEAYLHTSPLLYFHCQYKGVFSQEEYNPNQVWLKNACLTLLLLFDGLVFQQQPLFT
ncbi:uncharacterized protein LOC115076083 [Rhinatrema bivittatum]|uniref:uncharacterized protein LOC115076083 n=1 Tax=Rhinatrema bivittatum TaxID=194408 RepID=UPI0011279AF7|nr:uncharacterized protein LOC115076083 [Rhinatrema bivittatum]